MTAASASDVAGERLLFVGGLHRSGTSILHRCLADHPDVSGFAGTGVPEDEGQHLQSVYPAARAYGGPGRFGFHPEAHLTERSPLVSDENRRRLLAEWGRLWDASKARLVEKSPPNLIRMRFLQALFPGARFVMMMRHPIAVACATQKWSWTSYTSLIEHWLVCHETMLEDAEHVDELLILRYEDFVADPDAQLHRVFELAGLEPHRSGLTVRTGINDRYFERFAARRWNPWKRFDADRALRRFEERVSRFGYSLRTPRRVLPPSETLIAAGMAGGR
jgi:hypothetical protein